MSEWQPIETAPKDGTEFQAWVHYHFRSVVKGHWEPRVRFNVNTKIFETWGLHDHDMEEWGSDNLIVFTHWLPFPAPPEEAK